MHPTHTVVSDADAPVGAAALAVRTDMRVGISAAEALNPAPNVIVVLTDGDTPWPGTPTRARLIAVLTRDRGMSRLPTWARGIHVPPAATS